MSDVEDFRGWLQDYSKSLPVFFEATARIKHSVTIGNSREATIFAFLDNVLPESAKFIRTPIVINRHSEQSPSFDGVFYDPRFLPRFSGLRDVDVLFLEAVCLVAEIKSSYVVKQRNDVYRKIEAFEQLYDGGQSVAPSFCFFMNTLVAPRLLVSTSSD